MARVSMGGGYRPPSGGTVNSQVRSEPQRRPAPRKAPVVRAPVKRSSSSGAAARRVSYKAPVRRAPAYRAPAPRPAPKAAPPKPPAPPTIAQFLAGDTTYMGQEAALKKAMANYNTQYANQGQQYGEEYNLNKGNLGTALKEANTGMTDDYGSRGMLNSGLYGKAYADQQTEYQGRQAALDNARTQFLSDQLASKTNFTSEQGLTGQKARQDAINRRAAQYA